MGGRHCQHNSVLAFTPGKLIQGYDLRRIPQSEVDLCEQLAPSLGKAELYENRPPRSPMIFQSHAGGLTPCKSQERNYDQGRPSGPGIFLLDAPGPRAAPNFFIRTGVALANTGRVP